MKLGNLQYHNERAAGRHSLFVRVSRLAAVMCVSVGLLLAFGFATRTQDEYKQLFEKAVNVIKKYETLHTAKNWPYIGYGHRVWSGEKYKKGVVLSEKEADALLRQDLKKFIEYFKDQGEKAILLGTLAYNIGPGNVKKSAVYTKLKAGNTDIKTNYLNHSMYNGKPHAQLRQRRTEEYKLFAEFGMVKP